MLSTSIPFYPEQEKASLGGKRKLERSEKL